MAGVCYTVDHYPDPLFLFEAPDDLPVAPPANPARPNPAIDGSDLIGQWFLDPELGPCHITRTDRPFLHDADVGNRDASAPMMASGWKHTLRYVTSSGDTHWSSVEEVARWVELYPHNPVLASPMSSPPPSSPPLPVVPPHPPHLPAMDVVPSGGPAVEPSVTLPPPVSCGGAS